jgi:hypothetical protein
MGQARAGLALQQWLVIRSILFDCYESKAFGTTFKSPDWTVRLYQFCAGFVGNTASYVNKFLQNIPPTLEAMMAMLTHDLKLRSDFLRTSGGALELPKCLYHYLNYSSTKIRKPFLQGTQIGPDVIIQVGDHLQQIQNSTCLLRV